MACAEAEGRRARVEAAPEVVRKRDRDLLVLRPVGVRVSDEHSFEVVRELAVGYGDACGPVCDVKEAVVAAY